MFDSKVHFPLRESKAKRKKYTFKEYLDFEAKSIEKHEFIDGKIVKMPYAKGPHNIIAVNMSTVLSNALELLEKDYVVFGPDQKIYLPSLNVGVYADAFAVAESPIYFDDDQLLLINPLLVVEVLSKSTSKYDRTGKFDKYKTLDSFREYVLIRQDEYYAEVWYREKIGYWEKLLSPIFRKTYRCSQLGSKFRWNAFTGTSIWHIDTIPSHLN